MASVFTKFCFLFLIFVFVTPLSSQQKIRKNTWIDGENREYFIAIPTSYTGNIEVPLVFMLHGTGGDGEKMYETSGWAELSEKEGFIAVFPSSMQYKINDNGELKTTKKWNTTPDADWTFQPGEEGKDDIKFLRSIIIDISDEYKINTNRIYLNGFSNGGAMAARCSIEMSDVLAAVCSSAAAFHIDTIYSPARRIPFLFQLGNKDYGPGNVGPEFPEVPMLYFDSLITTPDITYLNGKHYRIANNCIRNFALQRNHTIVGDSNRVLIATFLPQDINEKHEFKYIFVKGLAHSYPNWAPTEHWKWLYQFTKENTNLGDFSLIVNDGYGTGTYEKNKIRHVWAKQIDDKVFTHWSGDIQYLNLPNEYHAIVTMPDRNVNITANFATLTPAMRMIPLTVSGAERSKNIYVYFPTDKNKTKGVVWFFHGTNGNAGQMVADPDVLQMMNLLMVKDYAVVAITSEESEFKIDFNNDGVYRYTYGIDSTLLDIANVRAIRDSMISKNLINPSTPHAAIGWSAGGAFTEFIANSLGWVAAINHTSSGSDILSINSLINVPYIISINENDNHPDVGPIGNQEARVNIQNYLERGACAYLHEHLKAPLYPERFDRSPLISESLSRNIFQEIKQNNGLDDDNFLILLSDPLALYIGANTNKFPIIASLSVQQKAAAIRQIEVTNAEHNIKADINGLTLDFIENACAHISGTLPNTSSKSFKIYPNPVGDVLNIGQETSYKIFNFQGILLTKGFGNAVDVSQMNVGIYFIQIGNQALKFIKI